MVVVLMLTVSTVISDRVLSRLDATQNRHLSELTNAYLDGISSSILPHVLRDDVWETYDALKRAGSRYRGLNVVWTTVVDANNRVIASSAPKQFPLQSSFTPDVGRPTTEETKTVVDHAAGTARFRRTLVYQERRIGAIHGQISIAALVAERWDVLKALILTNALLTLVLAGFGYLAIRRMLRPIGVLSGHMLDGTEGAVSKIPDAHLGREDSEFGQLFRSYNSLVTSVAERERLLKQLAEEERLASLGRLASGMAHEINNPLGGMLNAVDAIKKHGDRADVRITSIDLLRRGLKGMRGVVRSALATYRHDNEERFLSATELDDLALLVRPEVRRKRLQLVWINDLADDFAAPANPIRDAVLNLLLNACTVSCEGATVRFRAQLENEHLHITVRDEGPGLPRDVTDYLNAHDTRALPLEDHRGLGIWVVKRLLRDIDGTINAKSAAPKGTTITLTIPSALNRMEPKQKVKPSEFQ
ncbi:MAG: HAMP domain-containing sensor histidine kinase, partial [Pseudomonadota bacterium]